jgi:hypothetical protein
MTKTQQIATGLMGLLMFATILAMPNRIHAGANQATVLAAASAHVEASPELPQEQVRDLTF